MSKPLCADCGTPCTYGCMRCWDCRRAVVVARTTLCAGCGKPCSRGAPRCRACTYGKPPRPAETRAAPPGLWRNLGQEVLTAVCEYYEVPRSEALSLSRDPLLVEARRVVMRLLWELGLNTGQIAEVTLRHQATVGYHVGRYNIARGRRPSPEEEAVLAAVRFEMRRRGEWPAWAA